MAYLLARRTAEPGGVTGSRPAAIPPRNSHRGGTVLATRILVAIALGLMTLKTALPARSQPPAKPGDTNMTLTREQASAFAKVALKGIGKEYPNKLGHILAGP